MKPAKYLLLLLVVIWFAQSSCKKSEAPKEKTRTELLTQKPWIMVAYRSDWMREGNWKDEFSTLPACDIDDIFSFNTGGTAARDFSKVVCFPDPDLVKVIKGGWNWHVREQIIKIDDIGLNGTFSITYLDDDKLILQANYSFLTDEYTFIHP